MIFVRKTQQNASEQCELFLFNQKEKISAGPCAQCCHCVPYIGGVRPSLPTARRAAVMVPSAAFWAMTKTLAPTLASLC